VTGRLTGRAPEEDEFRDAAEGRPPSKYKSFLVVEWHTPLPARRRFQATGLTREPLSDAFVDLLGEQIRRRGQVRKTGTVTKVWDGEGTTFIELSDCHDVRAVGAP
jgi:hypothetical protein